MQLPLQFEPVRLWRALAPKHIEDSPVKRLLWEDGETLLGLCGGETDYVFVVKNGELISLTPANEQPAHHTKLLDSLNAAPAPRENLPYYPGRQYQAVAVKEAPYGGKTVVGTRDGMLAVCEGKRVFSLGPAAYNGPVRDLSAMPDGSAVYGVGGDRDDIGILFSYDETNGLRWLGHVSYDAPCAFSPVHCNVLSACAVSPDGKTLAVGSGDRLGTLMFYRLA